MDIITIGSILGSIWVYVQIDSKLHERKVKSLELINELLRLRIDNKRDDYNQLVLTCTLWRYREGLSWTDMQDPIKHIYAMQQYTMSRPHMIPNWLYQLYLKRNIRL
jgi:hypothetical protein